MTEYLTSYQLVGRRLELVPVVGGQGALHLPPLRAHRPQSVPLHLGHTLLQTVQRAEEAGETLNSSFPPLQYENQLIKGNIVG